MSREDEIRHAFLVKHEHADELWFDEETGNPISARYYSGFTSQAMRDADLRRFFEAVERRKNEMEEPSDGR